MAQRRTHTSFAKELYYILCLVVFIVSAIFTVWGPGGLRDMKRAQRELATRRANVDALVRRNKELLDSVEALKSSKEALERIARDNGYARPQEIIQPIPAESKQRDEKKSPSKP